jgi:hypothetical protein
VREIEPMLVMVAFGGFRSRVCCEQSAMVCSRMSDAGELLLEGLWVATPFEVERRAAVGHRHTRRHFQSRPDDDGSGRGTVTRITWEAAR